MTRCDECSDGWYRFFKYRRLRAQVVTVRKCGKCGKIKQFEETVKDEKD